MVHSIYIKSIFSPILTTGFNLKSVSQIKLNFAQKVADTSTGLCSDIAKIALDKNEIDQLISIFIEQQQTNEELFRKMMGEEVYGDFLKIIETKQANS